MSKTFEFSDGHATQGAEYDAFAGRRGVLWTREDLYYAIRAFCKTHSPQEATEIFYHCARVTHPDIIPSYAFGAIIAMMVQASTNRPFRGEVHKLRLPHKRDTA